MARLCGFPTASTTGGATLLTDPQTSGGLLIAVAADDAERVLSLVRERGFDAAAIVGRLRSGPPEIQLLALGPMALDE